MGYTNAGKSTLLNFLAKDDLFVENRLFATLDSYTRVVFLADKMKTLITDTVGFIRNLPANLIESFRSTLEEIKVADYLIHVVDISAIDIETNIKTVEKELIALDSIEKDTILFFNKTDCVDDAMINTIKLQYPDCLVGSVIEKNGIAELKQKILDLHLKKMPRY